MTKTIKVYVVARGPVDLRKVGLATSRLRNQLNVTFGKEGTNFTVEQKDINDPASRGDREYTLYLVAGDEAPTDLLARHNIKDDPSRLKQKELEKLFTSKDEKGNAIPEAGVHFPGTNVGFISADKIFDERVLPTEDYGSNYVKHELGHILIGAQCADHGGDDPDRRQICGGVMQSPTPRREDLSYTPEFNATVREIYKLTVTATPLYTAVWEPSTEGEIQLYGWTEQDLIRAYTEDGYYDADNKSIWNQGYRLKLLSAYFIEGEVRYVAVFKPSQQDEILRYSLTDVEYRGLNKELQAQGWRLKLVEPYVRPLDRGVEVRYTVAWEPSGADPALAAADEMVLDEWEPSLIRDYKFSDRQPYEEKSFWDQGYRLKLLSNPFIVYGEVHYWAVFTPSQDDEREVYSSRYEEYRAMYDDLWDQGFRLKLLRAYVINNQVRYTAVWKPSTEGEIQVYSWPYEDYRALYDELWNQGWRLKSLVAVPVVP